MTEWVAATCADVDRGMVIRRNVHEAFEVVTVVELFADGAAAGFAGTTIRVLGVHFLDDGGRHTGATGSLSVAPDRAVEVLV